MPAAAAVGGNTGNCIAAGCCARHGNAEVQNKNPTKVFSTDIFINATHKIRNLAGRSIAARGARCL